MILPKSIILPFLTVCSGVLAAGSQPSHPENRLFKAAHDGNLELVQKLMKDHKLGPNIRFGNIWLNSKPNIIDYIRSRPDTKYYMADYAFERALARKDMAYAEYLLQVPQMNPLLGFHYAVRNNLHLDHKWLMADPRFRLFKELISSPLSSLKSSSYEAYLDSMKELIKDPNQNQKFLQTLFKDLKLKSKNGDTFASYILGRLHENMK